MIYNWFIKLFDTNKDGSIHWSEFLGLIYTLYMGVIVIATAVNNQPFTAWHIAFVALGSLGHAAIEMAKVMVDVKSFTGGSQEYNTDDHKPNIEE